MRFILIILLLIFSYFVIAQTAGGSTVIQKKDTPGSKGIYRCTAYFSGNGLPRVKTATYFGPDIHLLMKQIDSASNGAIVTIENLRFTGEDGKTTMINQVPYNFNKSAGDAKFKSSAVLQIEELKSFNFVSGIIYFSGAGYPNVLSVKVSDTITLHKCYERSSPGTIITLSNCMYKDSTGFLSVPLNRSIKLE